MAAASEKDAVTSIRIAAGFSAATDAASMAAASSMNLDRMTWLSVTRTWPPSVGMASCTSALLMVSSRPSAVESAAAKPPAATRPDTT